MPKQKLKTHKATAKRVKVTANKEILRERAGLNHFKQKKSAARKRRINSAASIKGKRAVKLMRALGGAR